MTEKRKKQEKYFDFNGAFVYCPKGMKTNAKDVILKHAYFVTNKSIEEASKMLKSEDYRKWLGSFKKLKKTIFER